VSCAGIDAPRVLAASGRCLLSQPSPQRLYQGLRIRAGNHGWEGVKRDRYALAVIVQGIATWIGHHPFRSPLAESGVDCNHIRCRPLYIWCL
jgi:hypothetical protein